MIDNTKEYILCAAIKRYSTNDCHKCYNEEYRDLYDIELGWRHADILHRFPTDVTRKLCDQGFYTSKGRFVDRVEGLRVARECGQFESTEYKRILFSEDLY